jgi:hypothetical protein
MPCWRIVYGRADAERPLAQLHFESVYLCIPVLV